jgi:hypothetical protein
MTKRAETFPSISDWWNFSSEHPSLQQWLDPLSTAPRAPASDTAASGDHLDQPTATLPSANAKRSSSFGNARQGEV